MEDLDDSAAESGIAMIDSPNTDLSVRIDCCERVNYAMQQSGIPIVSRVLITNTGDEVAEGIIARLWLTNDESAVWEKRIDRIARSETYHLDASDFQLDPSALAKRTESERTLIRSEVRVGDAEITHSDALELLAYNEWPGISISPEIISAFVTPNHSVISEVLTKARRAMGELDQSDALDGYQSGSGLRVTKLAEACFNALASFDIGYINPPASFESTGQRIRLADEILRNRLGTCIDLSLFLASLWEQIGLHPLIVLTDGHAMPAFWTRETDFQEVVVEEVQRLRNHIELGEIVVLESTLLTQQGGHFRSAVEAANRRLREESGVAYTIDVKASRKMGVRPLPVRADPVSGETSLDPTANSNLEVKLASGEALSPVELAARAESGMATSPTDAADQMPRVEKWKRRLLDLSLRNRLLNFRQTARTIGLDVHDVAVLEDVLASGKSFEIHCNPKHLVEDKFFEKELAAKRLYSLESDAETAKRLLNIYRLARSAIQETGANILYLALGSLTWYETDFTDTARTAPLILLPITLTRTSTGTGYRYDLRLSDEPLRPNVTLLEKLRFEFGIDCQDLEHLPEDESGIDVPLILRRFREAIRDSKRWEVHEKAVVGLFSFNKFLMWRDVQEYEDQLKRNRLVGHLISGSSAAFDEMPLPEANRMDDECSPGDLLCTRDADSSQLAAVHAASQGRTFVLEGPPGTGKTQTITNIIADAIGHGKRVLFVAEKLVALEQVQKRLEEDGLGAECLELHSAKASKKEVLKQLGRSLKAVREQSPREWESACAKLASKRTVLNAYVRAMHEPRPSGETVYQVLGRLEHLGDGPRVEPPKDDLIDVPSEDLSKWREHVRMASNAARAVDPVCNHALRGIERSDWSVGYPEQAQEVINGSLKSVGQLRKTLGGVLDALKISDSIGLASKLAFKDIRAVCELSAMLFKSIPCPAELLNTDEWPPLKAKLTDDLRRAASCNSSKASLESAYHKEFFKADHLALLDKAKRTKAAPIPISWYYAWKLKKQVRPYCKEGVPEPDQLVSQLEQVRAFNDDHDYLESSDCVLSRLFGANTFREESKWPAVRKSIEWAEKFRLTLSKMSDSAVASLIADAAIRCASDRDARSSIKPSAKLAVEAFNHWGQTWPRLHQTLRPANTWSASTEVGQGWFESTESVMARWRDSLGHLNDWTEWRRVRSVASDVGLEQLLTKYESGEITREVISDVFERGYGKKWYQQVADSNTELRLFNANTHESTIDEFRELDQTVLQMTRSVIAARSAGPAIGDNDAGSLTSELALLTRELEKKSRHLPTRQLVERMPGLLPRLKPCFLMSPLSVAQYLDPNLPTFDLVVFDEASQIPVWDAIGAIARGTEVVVVGDSKQLPPTNFFGTIDGDDDDDDFNDPTVPEDMESILKECNAAKVPPLSLDWHYRSRHETLIAFSNYHYYDNNLHVFPSPMDRSKNLGVTFRHVEDGLYDRGKSRTNRREAEEIINYVTEELQLSGASGSIGIVTFSMQQQYLIEDLFDQRRRECPEIEPFFSDQSDGVFIKNLENVQGDERDTIIFSIGYGKDIYGKMTMNFGPINKSGGERRLNVAITRARRRLITFASITGDMIDLRRTRAVGVRHLKSFLEYAERGPKALAEVTEAGRMREFDSGFEKAVCDALESRGWELDTQVGCAGYRVDLGIRHPDRPGRYILGVECDGAMYHSSRVARDRDRLRQSVLEDLGWTIERVWSSEWRLNRGKCIDAIEQAIKRSLLS